MPPAMQGAEEDDTKMHVEYTTRCCQSCWAGCTSHLTPLYTERWACLEYSIPCPSLAALLATVTFLSVFLLIEAVLVQVSSSVAAYRTIT